ncbi:SDR family oxidoreductase [Anaerolineae bacterium CFX9]|jgi:putative NADH-flavin reductase|nr:SDR family oxidoreductase [Geitlerinema splendidum]MDL1902119.1 SDR family oxidoreductase [Anaerolineae bacterium CFX9]
MRIALFGGTGRTGIHIVEQALAQGHEVRLLARTPEKVTIKHPCLHVIPGDVRDLAAVERTIQDTEAVISVLGPSSSKPEFAVTQGTRNLLTAMQRHGVRRLIVSAGAGVRDPLDQPGAFDRVISAVLNIVSKHVVADMKQVVQLVRESDRSWTIVRVPMLTDDPPTGNLRVGYLGKGVGVRLSRADMAAFILRQLGDQTYLCQSPVISN